MRHQGVGAVIPRLITAADARFIGAGVLSLSRIESIQILENKHALGSSTAHAAKPRSVSGKVRRCPR
jgi:hypothetical protein